MVKILSRYLVYYRDLYLTANLPSKWSTYANNRKEAMEQFYKQGPGKNKRTFIVRTIKIKENII